VKIILLHGWNQNKEIWGNIISKLSNYNTLAIDLPGFGKEKITSQDWNITEYAKWTRKKIAKLTKGNSDIVLIGHSFGGRIATKIASENPKWLKGLILSGSPSIYRPKISTKIKIYAYKMIKIFIPHWLKIRFLPIELKRAYLSGMDTIFRKVVIYDQTNSLNKINVPTLLIWGENDIEVPLHIPKEIATKIKKSDLKIISKVGHNSFIDNPDLFTGYVKKFIENIK